MTQLNAPAEFNVVAKPQPTFYFIGVTTSKSAMMRLFPIWAKALGRPEVALEGVDLKLHDTPEAYRQAVAQIKYDPNSIGALVTTHKIDLVDATRDMFDYLDPYARLCNELSSISKREGRLEGHAKDPISSGLTLDAVLGKGYFGRERMPNAEVLCFGAGGSAVAIALHLINKQDPADRPAKFTMVNRSQPRLDAMAELAQKVGSTIPFEFMRNEDAARNDRIMAALPEGSIVINATGMGKDRPGSPITDAGVFPLNGVAWEYNYRGDLLFLRQAQAQKDSRNLTIEDGWVYFLHGWTQVIAQVFHTEIAGERFAELAKLAETIR